MQKTLCSVNSITYTLDFAETVLRLESGYRTAIFNVLALLSRDVNHSRLRFEKLEQPLSSAGELYSVRIPQTKQVASGMRIILVRRGEDFVALHVAGHQDVYRWVNQHMKELQVGDYSKALPFYKREETAKEAGRLFTESLISDEALRKMDVPESLIGYIRSIPDEEEFDILVPEVLNRDLYDKLYSFYYHEPPPAHDAPSPAGPVEEEEEPIQVVNANAALEEIIREGPLEQWRVFLHPQQERWVNMNAAGPVKVTGAAGTGKTVVAMHRAKYLAGRMKSGERLLLTTFTENLARDLEESLKRLCGGAIPRGVEVKHVDAVALRLGKGAKPLEWVTDHHQLDGMWQAAMDKVGDPCWKTPRAFREEWEQIAAEQNAFTLEAYLTINREGAAFPLPEERRRKVWEVIAAYLSLMEQAGKVDKAMLMHQAEKAAAADPQRQYQHIIADETQDFTAGQLRLLRALAGEEHENDLFLVGDAHQRIYGSRAALSRCGISVCGRSTVLRVNYRTTRQLSKAALGLLKNVNIDDMDGSPDASGGRSSTMVMGPEPHLLQFGTLEEEAESIALEITRLHEEKGVPLRNICVAAYGRLEGYIKWLREYGQLPVFEVKRGAVDEPTRDAVRVATMHRVKGLEFQYMFVAGVNAGVIPRKTPEGLPEPQRAQEEKEARCLLYVAITRAREETTISCYGKASPLFQELRAVSPQTKE